MLSLPKKLVVDAAILFSFFKKDATRRKVSEELLNNECKLISPYFALEELRNEKNRIMKFANITAGDFEFTLSTLENEIELVTSGEYKEFLVEAAKISPHEKDAQYFALALSLDCPLWSDEKAFKQQTKVKIFSTEELLREI